MYVQMKNKFLGQAKLEHDQDRQTDSLRPNVLTDTLAHGTNNN